ncbi:hypothetical protein GCM10010913_46030 [Paenibacillus aceti]|uniref:Uncharacterized protein n=1 Tax=Paenibacillus aceti TaxID=1820010 RepID=A0ABQ1W887_9BACL|nr:hypothetical protein GCM10010913_46030 [Paenibacillus aceti]
MRPVLHLVAEIHLFQGGPVRNPKIDANVQLYPYKSVDQGMNPVNSCIIAFICSVQGIKGACSCKNALIFSNLKGSFQGSGFLDGLITDE